MQGYSIDRQTGRQQVSKLEERIEFMRVEPESLSGGLNTFSSALLPGRRPSYNKREGKYIFCL